MRPYLLPVLLAFGTLAHAQQVPVIDYGFLAVPPSTVVNKVVVQPDGKVLVGGSFSNYAGSGRQNLVRLLSDGTLDPDWNPGGTGPGHLVEDIDLMPDGRILIAGAFTAYNGRPIHFVARLLPNGLPDTTFNIPANAINGAVHAVALHKDGKVLAAGDFFLCYGHSRPYITRFNHDGSLDQGFDIGTGFNDAVYDLVVLPGQGILCAGKFTAYNGNPCGRVARLTSGGPYDPSMGNVSGFAGGPARALVLQPDSQLLVAGDFNLHHALSANGIARLHLDGTRDPSFTSPFYPYAQVRAMAVLPDGRIMVGGEYTASMYQPAVEGPNAITLLHGDGSRDDGFPIGQGALPASGLPAAAIRSLAAQDDGKVVAGGQFGAIDTETQYRQLVRLQLAATAVAETDGPGAWRVFADREAGTVLLSDPFGGTGAADLQVHNSTGQLVLQARLNLAGQPVVRVPANLAPGPLFISLRQGGQRAVAKVMW